MLDFLKGSQNTIEIAPERGAGPYFPGETLTAHVSIELKKKLKVKEGWIALVCKQEFRYKTIETSTDDEGYTEEREVEHWKSIEHHFGKHTFLGEKTVSGRKTFTYTAEIPLGPPPTTQNGEIVRVNWFIKVNFDRRLARDVNEETPVMVARAPELLETFELYGGSSEPDEAEMFIEIPAIEWVNDETITGELQINPRKEINVTEIRMELERQEFVSYDQGNSRKEKLSVKVAEKTKLLEGQQVILPFQIRVPSPSPPSWVADDWTVVWVLRGVLARRLRKDTYVEEEITICTGRG